VIGNNNDISGGGDLIEDAPMDDELEGTSPPAPTIEALAAMEAQPPLPLEVVSRVSAYPRSRSWGKSDLAPVGHGVPTPPEWLWKGKAEQLRATLGLTLFNFDVIVPRHPPAHQQGLLFPAPLDGSGEAQEGLVHLIDINYYPGIEKLPNSEVLMVRFLQKIGDETQSTDAAAVQRE